MQCVLINQLVIVKYAPKACNCTDEILALSTTNTTNRFKLHRTSSFTCSFAFRAPRAQLTALEVFSLSEALHFVYSASKVHAKPGRESRLTRAQSESDKRELRMPSARIRVVLQIRAVRRCE